MRRASHKLLSLCGFLLLLCCLSAPLPAAADLQALIAETNTLRQAGDAEQAWQRLRAVEARYAGEPSFDLQLGFAALEAGHPEHAVFAFERVVLIHPWDQRARLELARAAYLAGNHKAARSAFEQVLASEPPPNVRARIEDYLVAIERTERSGQRHWSAYLDLRLGHDSNANSATTLSAIDIPALGVVTLDDSGRATADNFLEFSAGASLVQPVTRRFSLFADAGLKDRRHRDRDDADLRSLNLSAGPSYASDRDLWRLPLGVQWLYLDDRHFRRLLSLGPEWQRGLDKQSRMAVFAQFGDLDYPDDALRDARLLLGGASYTRQLEGLPLLYTVAAYVGDEHARRDAGAHNGRRYHGLRLDLQWQLDEIHTPYLSLLGQRARYDADNPVFLRTRDERFVELRLGWQYRMNDDWSVYAEASRARSDANIGLFDYTRTQVAAGVRRTFE